MTVSFDQITIDNRTYPMRGTVTQALESEGVRGEAGRIGAGAGVGAIIGGILGGLQGRARRHPDRRRRRRRGHRRQGRGVAGGHDPPRQPRFAAGREVGPTDVTSGCRGGGSSSRRLEPRAHPAVMPARRPRSAARSPRRARGWCIRRGMIVVTIPSCAAASAVTGPMHATVVCCSRSAACSSPMTRTNLRTADALVNVTASMLPLEQHAVDVGLAFALGLRDDRAVRHHVGDLRAGVPQAPAQQLAAARPPAAPGQRVPAQRPDAASACTTASGCPSDRQRGPASRDTAAADPRVAAPIAHRRTPFSARTSPAVGGQPRT